MYREGPTASSCAACPVPGRSVGFWPAPACPGYATRIRASPAKDHRYERDIPDTCFTSTPRIVDRIPDSGGQQTDLSQSRATHCPSGRPGSYYVLAAVACSPASPTPGPARREKPNRRQIPRPLKSRQTANPAPVTRVMTDSAFAYLLARDFHDALAALGAKHILNRCRHLCKRQSKTLQPHLPERPGAPRDLHLKPGPDRCVAVVAKLLQHSPGPPQPRSESTHQQVSTVNLPTGHTEAPRTHCKDRPNSNSRT